tara:strand:- start:33 stop:743 length:711 start_codon:yes stop_codon:yes gene_type:complete
MSATIIIGKHAVKQCLSSDDHIEKVFIRQRQRTNDDIKKIISIAKKKRILVQWLEPHRFDLRFSGDHQGIACITHGFKQCTVSELISVKPSVILMLDHLQDPHNFGAICRTAEAFGVTHICYPKDRAAQITPSVVKASAGAIQHITFCKMTNLANGLDQLSSNGYWVYGASSNKGNDLSNLQFNHPLVIICGSEEKGISPGLSKYIDEFIHISLKGKTSSLNVSVATAIIINKIAP